MTDFGFAFQSKYLARNAAPKILRAEAAAQIHRMRRLESSEPAFIKDSSLTDYLKAAKGLLAFLDHTRERQPAMLEIGSGTATALDQLAENQLGYGLTLMGTVLRHLRETKPNVTLRTTPAEILHRVPAKSVGGILSLGGIAFSAVPELVVNNINRTLVKGGILKATFRASHSYGQEWDEKYDEWGYRLHDPFSQELQRRRFDVAVMETEVDDIMVAIKPGVRKIATAQELLQEDARTLPEQLALVA